MSKRSPEISPAGSIAPFEKLGSTCNVAKGEGNCSACLTRQGRDEHTKSATQQRNKKGDRKKTLPHTTSTNLLN